MLELSHNEATELRDFLCGHCDFAEIGGTAQDHISELAETGRGGKGFEEEELYGEARLFVGADCLVEGRVGAVEHCYH